MTQAAIAELYQTKPQNITQHIKIFMKMASLKKIELVRITYKFQMEGSREIKRNKKHYS